MKKKRLAFSRSSVKTLPKCSVCESGQGWWCCGCGHDSKKDSLLRHGYDSQVVRRLIVAQGTRGCGFLVPCPRCNFHGRCPPKDPTADHQTDFWRSPAYSTLASLTFPEKDPIVYNLVYIINILIRFGGQPFCYVSGSQDPVEAVHLPTLSRLGVLPEEDFPKAESRLECSSVAPEDDQNPCWFFSLNWSVLFCKGAWTAVLSPIEPRIYVLLDAKKSRDKDRCQVHPSGMFETFLGREASFNDHFGLPADFPRLLWERAVRSPTVQSALKRQNELFVEQSANNKALFQLAHAALRSPV